MINNKIKVLLISPIPPPAGGIGTWTQQYIEWSKDNNLNIDVLNTAVIGKRLKRINDKMKISEEIVRTKSIISKLKYKIKKFEPNIIHLNTPCGKLGIIRDYYCAKIAKKNKKKLIVHYRCNIEDQIGNGIIQKVFLNKIATLADLNIVLNKSSQDYLKGKKITNTIYLPNYINKNYVISEKKNIRKNIKKVCFIGHVQEAKGAFEIIELAKIFPNIEFNLAGPIANEVINMELSNNLNLLGSLEKTKVKKILSESDVFLFPSHTEGFANALLEAMSMGLPVITTPVGANKEMIETFGGIIVEKGNINQMKDALVTMESQKKRQEYSNWNSNKVFKEYTIDNIMKKLVSLYQEDTQ